MHFLWTLFFKKKKTRKSFCGIELYCHTAGEQVAAGILVDEEEEEEILIKPHVVAGLSGLVNSSRPAVRSAEMPAPVLPSTMAAAAALLSPPPYASHLHPPSQRAPIAAPVYSAFQPGPAGQRALLFTRHFSSPLTILVFVFVFSFLFFSPRARRADTVPNFSLFSFEPASVKPRKKSPPPGFESIGGDGWSSYYGSQFPG